MAMSFPIRLGLMVGIEGESAAAGMKVDIRLGDVVDQPARGHPRGRHQYDLGKATDGGIRARKLPKRASYILAQGGRPSPSVPRGNESRIPEILQDMLEKNPRLAKAAPGETKLSLPGPRARPAVSGRLPARGGQELRRVRRLRRGAAGSTR